MTFGHLIQNDFTVNKYLYLISVRAYYKKTLANSCNYTDRSIITYYQIIDI